MPPMPTYKGNRGNLLQHWVLAELVAELRRRQGPARLCFIDAHAMSPFAVRDENPGPTRGDYDAVACQLPGQGSEYEQTWNALRGDRVQYPSSALFVRQLWHGPMHLILCEAHEATAGEIAEWLRVAPPNTSWELHRGDWRQRFRERFPVIGFEAFLISFDPYMFDRHGPPAHSAPGNMWPSDIIRAGAAVLDLRPVPVVVQLSTYSANNGNGQDDVLATISPILAAADLELAATVRADGNMMTMVFTRRVQDIRGLQERFDQWRERLA